MKRQAKYICAILAIVLMFSTLNDVAVGSNLRVQWEGTFGKLEQTRIYAFVEKDPDLPRFSDVPVVVRKVQIENTLLYIIRGLKPSGHAIWILDINLKQLFFETFPDVYGIEILAIQDLTGDKRPEIIIEPRDEGDGTIIVLENRVTFFKEFFINKDGKITREDVQEPNLLLQVKAIGDLSQQAFEYGHKLGINVVDLILSVGGAVK